MNANISTLPFSVNGRRYEPPAKPVVAICMDGCEDDYLKVAIARGRMPHLARMAADGYRGLVRAALPTYTNVNNACIVSGVPPSVTGISGNFFLDPGSGAEVMMNSARYLRCDTILAAAARSGRKVAMVTAKEKLRDLLTRGLQGIAFRRSGPLSRSGTCRAWRIWRRLSGKAVPTSTAPRPACSSCAPEWLCWRAANRTSSICR